MAASFPAVVQQHGDWWIGWVEEVPGVNSQGTTREELLDNLRDALEEALGMDRATEDDPLVDELLTSGPGFQALVDKSRAGPRKPLAPVLRLEMLPRQQQGTEGAGD